MRWLEQLIGIMCCIELCMMQFLSSVKTFQRSERIRSSHSTLISASRTEVAQRYSTEPVLPVRHVNLEDVLMVDFAHKHCKDINTKFSRSLKSNACSH